MNSASLTGRQAPSIFNDIVGPTMVGPSSSHTCGPARIGYLCQQLLDGKLESATVEFARDGAYTLMYKGQRSDMGFASGLQGYRPEDPRLRKSFELAREAGIDIRFVISDFVPVKPNHAIITMHSDTGSTTVVHTDSTGGGTLKLFEIDGFAVSIVGDCYELLVETATDSKEKSGALAEKIAALFDGNEGISVSAHNGASMINVHLRADPENQLAAIRAMDGVTRVRIIRPVLAISSNRHAQMPFTSAKELLELAEKENRPLCELAIDYECARSGWTREQVWDYMRYVVETMESGVAEALTGNIDMHGIIEPTAGKIFKAGEEKKQWIDMGVLNTAVPWGMATMEYSSAMGVVICAPTGGSAGVFPGAILGTATNMKLSMDDKIKAMFACAITGIVMSKEHNYSAELYGCQVEPGAASGMAAAGLVAMMGGTPRQSLDAASCAVQNILGTICDPVAGLVQVPCISRNAMSVANAVVSANMVLAGYDPLIPLDETAETLFRVGMQLPSELRCTCKGGLCITAAGKRLAQEQDVRDNMR